MGTLVGIACCVGNRRAVATAPAEVEPTGIMTFADPAMQALCAKTWGDGTNITYEQAREVTEIPKNWAKDNTAITSFNEIKYFKNLLYIRERAFTNCSNLVINEISLPNLLLIELSAFASCTALGCELLNLPSCETLGTTVFYNSSIKKVVMPKLKTIADSYKDYGCFQKIPNLESVTLRDIEYIGDYSFKDATKLVFDSIEYPNLTRIGTRAFENCKFTLNKAILPSCKKIEEFAFYGCSSMALTKLELPQCTSIGNSAFNGCPLLSEITLQNVTTVGAQAFRGTGISKIKLPSVKTMAAVANYDGIFSYCTNLVLVDLGGNCSSIGNESFGRSVGTSGKNITLICRASTPPTLGGSIISKGLVKATIGEIYVPDESVEAYKTATNWSAYANKILPLSQYNG